MLSAKYLVGTQEQLPGKVKTKVGKTKSDKDYDILFGFTNFTADAWHLLSHNTDLRLMLKTKDMEDLFLDFLFQFFQVSVINSHSIGGPVTRRTGSGLFALCSLLSHSCAPIVIRVVDGGQIFDSYCSSHCEEDLKARQGYLKP